MTDVNPIEQLAHDMGGRIDSAVVLPDGSGFATMSLPLPKDHWLTAEHDDAPPMPWRCSNDHPDRKRMVEAIRAAGKYALRGATMRGKDMDLDPDALLQNLVVGFLGYWTADGLSSDAWANPDPVPALLGAAP